MWVGMDPLDFTWTSRTPAPSTGQTPRATRYAKRYRVNWIIRCWPLLLLIPWEAW